MGSVKALTGVLSVATLSTQLRRTISFRNWQIVKRVSSNLIKLMVVRFIAIVVDPLKDSMKMVLPTLTAICKLTQRNSWRQVNRFPAEALSGAKAMFLTILKEDLLFCLNNNHNNQHFHYKMVIHK